MSPNFRCVTSVICLVFNQQYLEGGLRLFEFICVYTKEDSYTWGQVHKTTITNFLPPSAPPLSTLPNHLNHKSN